MNRRNFLKSIGKICAVLPFVGSSSAVGQSGASDGQPKWIEESFRRQSICRPKPTGTRPATELRESRSFIYQGYYFTVQDIYDSELKYIALHPFFKIQGILSMFILNDQFDDLQRRDMFLDEMIRQWKEKQVYTTEELREF